MGVSLNTRYLTSNRGVIRIIQIILGFYISSVLCGYAFAGGSCFHEGRLGFASGLNFVCIIINIVFFFLNFLNLTQWGLERIYAILAAIGFLIASGIMVWYLIDGRTSKNWASISACAALIGQFVLHLWDVRILQGESPN